MSLRGQRGSVWTAAARLTRQVVTTPRAASREEVWQRLEERLAEHRSQAEAE